MRLTELFLVAIILAGAGAQRADANDRSFITGVAGSNPSNPKDQARTYFNMGSVRALVERLESRPLTEADVRSALKGSDATLEDLVRLKILRRDVAGYVIGFNYFTLEDMRLIHASAERFVPGLVAAYGDHAGEFDRIFARYPVPSVNRKALAAAVIGGFGLNWDALQMTRDRGFRQPQLLTGAGWKYSFFAAEEDRDYPVKGFIWGSSSLFATGDNFAERPVDFIFSSFGDPLSDPRMNFPDLFYLPVDQLSPEVRKSLERIGLRSESYSGHQLADVLGVSRARSIGPMLFALRQRPQTRASLIRHADTSDRSKASHLVDLLVAIHSIRKRRDGRYELMTPVFDKADAPMLAEALALHRRILGTWLERSYPAMRDQLSPITAVKQGVPFESAFTQIWHDYFGLATRELAKAGVIADLNAPASPYRGSIPVLWRRSIYQLDLG